MILRYTAVFAIGGFSHRLTLHETYTKEQGLSEAVLYWQSPRKSEILKDARSKLTKPQYNSLQNLMSDRINGILDEQAKYYNY